MIHIQKYALQTVPISTVMMPRHARILCVQSVQGIVFLYAQINSEYISSEERTFFLCVLGEEIIEDANKYIGSVHMGDVLSFTPNLTRNVLVLHVYECIRLMKPVLVPEETEPTS